MIENDFNLEGGKRDPKGDQFWVFIGRTDAEAEIPILWPPHVKSWLTGKDPDAGRDWKQEEKGMTEDEMAGWHHRLDGHEFGWTPGVGDGQGGLECCDSWGCKESDMTERLNWTKLNGKYSEDHSCGPLGCCYSADRWTTLGKSSSCLGGGCLFLLVTVVCVSGQRYMNMCLQIEMLDSPQTVMC